MSESVKWANKNAMQGRWHWMLSLRISMYSRSVMLTAAQGAAKWSAVWFSKQIKVSTVAKTITYAWRTCLLLLTAAPRTAKRSAVVCYWVMLICSPPNYQKYWFFQKKYGRQWPMGGLRPGTIGLVTWPKKFSPKFWTSTIFMPKSRHKWRYDMEMLTFLQNQNMHDKEPREGHVKVSSVWSRDPPIFPAKF